VGVEKLGHLVRSYLSLGTLEIHAGILHPEAGD
jgi:hypothetical protein